MMKLIGPNHVASDKFSLQTLNRNFVLYQEGDKELKIEREAGYDPDYYEAVYLSVCKEWDTPKRLITNEERSIITQNIKAGNEFMGTRAKIE